MNKKIKRLLTALSKQVEYNYENKKEFLLAAKGVLKEVAEALALNPNEYEIRTNKAGIAVSGEVTLHAENVYIQFDKGCVDRGMSFMFRGCMNQKDYSGLANRWMKYEKLASDWESAIEAFKSAATEARIKIQYNAAKAV